MNHPVPNSTSAASSLLDPRRSVLLIIDLQGRLVEMVHRHTAVLESSRRLLKLAELFNVPVILSEQYPKGLGVTHPDIRAAYDDLSVERRYMDKVAFGCCGDAAFEPLLAELLPGLEPARRQVVIAGIEAHVCVMQTVLPLLAAGNEVHLCWDAVSSRGEEYYRWAMQRMLAAGAVPTNHESVGFEWAGSKEHPQFKAMSSLFKEGQPA
jgi:nicotinamidase-related amidase